MSEFTPHMPEVQHGMDLKEVFVEARQKAAKGLALVDTARQVAVQAAPNQVPPDVQQRIAAHIQLPAGSRIAAIACTDPAALQADIHQAIPFYQELLALAALGHHVWLFEGHPSALAEGVREADLLIIDEAMRPHLFPDWWHTVMYVWGGGRTVLIWGRDGQVTPFDIVRQVATVMAQGQPGQPSFQPKMPLVDVPVEMEKVFAQARATADKQARHKRGKPHYLAIVTPGRMIMEKKTPPYGAMKGPASGLKGILEVEPPASVAVISYTDLKALQANINQCIPFLGHLMRFAYHGYKVWVFEGHPTALIAGVREADVVMVDSGMAPFMQADWQAVIKAHMRGNRLLIHDRESYNLLLVK